MGEDAAPKANLAAADIEYKTVETKLGTWKVFVYSSGAGYREFTSRASVGNWPLIHITIGRNPETGSRKTAMGILAIGRFAMGFLAIGQVAAGIITIAQLGVGFLFLAQAGIGWAGVGQVAIAYQLALGQVAVAQTAIGQFAFGKYALGQFAFGKHAWSMKIRDPEAVRYFTALWDWTKSLLGR